MGVCDYAETFKFTEPVYYEVTVSSIPADAGFYYPAELGQVLKQPADGDGFLQGSTGQPPSVILAAILLVKNLQHEPTIKQLKVV